MCVEREREREREREKEREKDSLINIFVKMLLELGMIDFLMENKYSFQRIPSFGHQPAKQVDDKTQEWIRRCLF